MKIAVIAANGKAGQLIVKEAQAAGHEVTAIVRGENRSAATNVIMREIMNITAEDLAGFGAFTPETLPLHTKSVAHLGDVLAGSDARLYVVGGAGSMIVDDKGTKLLETPDFPNMFVPLASAQSEQLDYLRMRDDFNWTFVSPAAEFDAEGERTGKFEIVASDKFTVDANGNNEISYADYALGMVALIEAGSNNHKRVNIRH
ncbi:NAD(P)H-binding protein [Corynebacterium phoceense]|uniref:NAD(P)-dependent oxidoreductase n=1 Tax=Corynebacterium phoceense TaxID=1686286 RepID=UPI00211C2A40|nr:NAD(P)H-binding protein [Corynebacterium phoceense]MCQ9340908.1 NAD(P)H-binding protein [Corynebacterium phoceense]